MAKKKSPRKKVKKSRKKKGKLDLSELITAPKGEVLPEEEPVITELPLPQKIGAEEEAGPAEEAFAEEKAAEPEAPAGETAQAAQPAQPARPAQPIDDLQAAVEAVVFAADDPPSAAAVARAVGSTAGRVKKAVDALKENYEARGGGLSIEFIAGGYAIQTREEFAPAIRRLRRASERSKLSPAALETLAVVAYRQPVIKTEIEDIRGVSCGPILRALLEKGLVKIVGRAEQLGRPLLYGTTKPFLDTFGLGSTKDLPKMSEVEEAEGGEAPQAEGAPAAEARGEEAASADEGQAEPEEPPGFEP